MITIAGYILIALGIGHTVVGVVKYRTPLTGLFRDGYFNAAVGHADRLLAFWFLLFAVMLLLLGQSILHAEKTGDDVLLEMLAWYVTGIGVAGAAALPRSPFWVAVVLGPLILWNL